MPARTATSAVDIALLQARPLPDGAAAAPDWVMLLPSGAAIETVDGRGPYRVEDAAALVAASLSDGRRLPIDENHATDLAAPQGGPSPARGWIVALEARAEGIWGQVEWTEAGRQLLAERAYRYLSPVIRHLKDGRVTELLRAALTNVPNLRGMAALNSESTMDLLAQLRTALGLKSDADETAALAAVTALTASASAHAAALGGLAKAAGLPETAEATAILSAVTTLADGSEAGDQVKALQAELATVSTALQTLRDGVARGHATAAVDAAIAAGKPGVKPLRDHYIARHMADPASVEKELAGLPSLTRPSGAGVVPPARGADGEIALNAEQRAVAKLLGIAPEDYRKTLAAEAAATEAAA